MTGKEVGMSCGAQEEPMGYEQLADMLGTRIPAGASLKVSDFMEVETVLALMLEVGGDGIDPVKANRILSNYSLLRPESFGRREHLLQMGRRNLLSLSSGAAWYKNLKLYKGTEFDGIRFFDVNESAVKVRESSFGGVDRRPIYLDHLLNSMPNKRKVSKVEPGKKYRYYAKAEVIDKEKDEASGTMREVCIPDGVVFREETPAESKHKKTREAITVRLPELIAVAEEIGRQTGKGYYADVLSKILDQGLLKEVEGSNAKATDVITLEQVVSLVGLVGSGKSVLANVLTVALARRGFKVACLMNSVSDVAETVVFLRQAGVEASPLVAKGNRLERLNELRSQKRAMLLDDDIARYLETPCLIDGLSAGEESACSYETVPCHGLRSEKLTTYVCPCWDICPSQAMARESAVSSVVVTTPGGFSLMTVGKGRETFFERVLSEFDLVLFDEADRVQSQLDASFAPKLSFQELIYHSANPVAAAMKRKPSSKMQDLNVEHFYDCRQSAEPVAKAILLSAKKPEVASWEVVKGEAFTSLMLLRDLEKQGLPKAIVDDLEARIGGRCELGQQLDLAIRVSCNGVNEEAYNIALDGYLSERDVSVGEEMRARLSFALKVIYFEEYLRDLADSSDYLTFKDESMAELYSFLRFSCVRQQRYLPSSLIGNLFGMRMGDENDLILFRQFAVGRTFMNSLPWLDTDAEGNPAGPHILLLSGSSYEPGCLQYHINRPVNYLLEAQPWIAEKLASSVVRDLGITQNVSGSSKKLRLKNLNVVLSELMETLVAELESSAAGKILIVVNSYQEAEDAREKLESLFRSNGMPEKVCALTKTVREDRERFVPRSEVYRFSDHVARILVAPALAIERGYNIVDIVGHAAFSTVVFAVRPMGTPSDIGDRFRRVNGLIEDRVGSYPENPAEFAMKVREDAWACWKTLESDELLSLSSLRAADRQTTLRDTIATLMVTIVQIFGRLARLKDPDRPAPHVYFADAAFRGPDDDNAAAFRTLEELGAYMGEIIESSEQPVVARALYGPFYEAFKKGIK